LITPEFRYYYLQMFNIDLFLCIHRNCNNIKLVIVLYELLKYFFLRNNLFVLPFNVVHEYLINYNVIIHTIQ